MTTQRKATEELADIADAEFEDDAFFTNTEEWLETFRRLVVENERECAEPLCYLTEEWMSYEQSSEANENAFPVFTFPPAAQVPEDARKVFICRDCGFPYVDQPTSQCDCLGREIYDEGYIVMLAAAPEVK